MIKKIVESIKKGNFFHCIMIRLRITLHIQNQNVYSNYVSSKRYSKLKRKYQKEISEGIDTSKIRKIGDTIWIMWLQGLENAPDIVKVCIRSVTRAAENSGYKVVLLTEDNYSDYVALPDYINQKWRNGNIPRPHYTTILRTALLCRYGGGWIDATVLCTSDYLPEYITSSELFVYQDIEWSDLDKPWSVLSNWLIFSESNHPLLLMTQKLLYAYWKRENRRIDYFLYHMLFTFATERYPEEWAKVPVYSNEPPRILQFELDKPFSEIRWKQIIEMTNIHKLDWRKKGENDHSMYEYIVMMDQEESKYDIKNTGDC